MRTNQSFQWLRGSRILSILCFGSSDGLQYVDLLRTGEVHDNSAVVGPNPESGVVLCLYGRGSFLDIAQAEYVVDGCAESQTWIYFLLLDRRDLDKLAAHLDDDFDFPLGLGQPCYGLKNVPHVRHYADSLLGKVKLA